MILLKINLDYLYKLRKMENKEPSELEKQVNLEKLQKFFEGEDIKNKIKQDFNYFAVTEINRKFHNFEIACLFILFVSPVLFIWLSFEIAKAIEFKVILSVVLSYITTKILKSIYLIKL